MAGSSDIGCHGCGDTGDALCASGQALLPLDYRIAKRWTPFDPSPWAWHRLFIIGSRLIQNYGTRLISARRIWGDCLVIRCRRARRPADTRFQPDRFALFLPRLKEMLELSAVGVGKNVEQ